MIVKIYINLDIKNFKEYIIDGMIFVFCGYDS